jgi:hypothetical protein
LLFEGKAKIPCWNLSSTWNLPAMPRALARTTDTVPRLPIQWQNHALRSASSVAV